MSEASQKIRDRVRRLRERTTDRGCTEAEAMSAAEKAAQLMRDYGLSDIDILMDEQSSPSKQRGGSPKARLWPVIAYCTNTASIVLERMNGADVAFIGREPGPVVAVYLRDVCERAVDRAVREFKTGTFYRRRRGLASKRAAANAFVDGMVSRLNSRLVELFGPSVSAVARDEASAALEERYPRTVPVKRPRRDLRHNAAANAGWYAGNEVNLAHGVGGVNAPLQIGRAE